MKYLFIAVMFLAGRAGGQTVGELRFDKMPVFVHGLKTEIIPFCACAQLTGFFRFTGKVIEGYDSTGLCKHIYVAVEPDTVYESHGATGGPSPAFGPRPTGKKIICVKCHHITDQMITSTYSSGRSKLVPVDSVKIWLGYSPIKSDAGYKLFWHPGLRQLNQMYRALIFGEGFAPIGYNTLPGALDK